MEKIKIQLSLMWSRFNFIVILSTVPYHLLKIRSYLYIYIFSVVALAVVVALLEVLLLPQLRYNCTWQVGGTKCNYKLLQLIV